MDDTKAYEKNRFILDLSSIIIYSFREELNTRTQGESCESLVFEPSEL